MPAVNVINYEELDADHAVVTGPDGEEVFIRMEQGRWVPDDDPWNIRVTNIKRHLLSLPTFDGALALAQEHDDHQPPGQRLFVDWLYMKRREMEA